MKTSSFEIIRDRVKNRDTQGESIHQPSILEVNLGDIILPHEG